MDEKIKAVKWEIQWSEFNVGSHTFKDWREFSEGIYMIGYMHEITYGESGGYKTDFKITFADGFEYQGRIDCGYHDRLIVPHITHFLKVYSGQHKPAHMTTAQYAEFIEWFTTQEKRDFYADLLARYEIGEAGDGIR